MGHQGHRKGLQCNRKGLQWDRKALQWHKLIMYPLHNLVCHLVLLMLPCQGHHHSRECRDILLSKMVLSGKSEVLSLAMQHHHILASQTMEHHPLHLPLHQLPQRDSIPILSLARFRL